MAEKDLNTARRRLAFVANHLVPVHLPPICGSIGLRNASMNDSYHRIHGAVPTHEAVWTIACDECGKEFQFTDIIYEKAVGEGIAKVCFSPNFAFYAF
jgi:naphthoate synthase